MCEHLKFTDAMHERAEAEGWWLSERDDGFYQIQRFDEDPLERFETDDEAMLWVAQCAVMRRSFMHRLALLLDGMEVRP